MYNMFGFTDWKLKYISLMLLVCCAIQFAFLMLYCTVPVSSSILVFLNLHATSVPLQAFGFQELLK